MSETTLTPEKRAVLMVIAWAWVLGPFAYGLDQLIVKVAKLFNG